MRFLRSSPVSHVDGPAVIGGQAEESGGSV
jgi:hypothetical protein